MRMGNTPHMFWNLRFDSNLFICGPYSKSSPQVIEHMFRFDFLQNDFYFVWLNISKLKELHETIIYHHYLQRSMWHEHTRYIYILRFQFVVCLTVLNTKRGIGYYISLRKFENLFVFNLMSAWIPLKENTNWKFQCFDIFWQWYTRVKYVFNAIDLCHFILLFIKYIYIISDDMLYCTYNLF